MEGEEKKPMSEARRKSLDKYWSKFQQVKFYCEPDLYDEMKKACAAAGESMASFMKRAIQNELASKNSEK